MKIGMLGMGKLGLPVALAIESRGHEVLGFDKNRAPYEYIHDRAIPFVEKDIDPLLEATKIQMVDAVSDLFSCDIVFVAVQTPHREIFDGTYRITDPPEDFDYHFLEDALSSLSGFTGVAAVISTCLPGTFDAEISGSVPPGVQYVYTPQFIAMGTVLDDYLNPEFDLIGVRDPDASDLLEKFYKTINDAPIIRTDITTAEGIKVSYNTWITAKIALANYWGEMSYLLGMDFSAIHRSWQLSTRRLLSDRYTDAGVGDGGGCLTPGQEIVTSKGLLPIESVEVGDMVLTHLGRWRRVLSTFEREYNGDVRQFRLAAAGSRELLTVTPEHPIMLAERRTSGPRILDKTYSYDDYNRQSTRLAPPLSYNRVGMVPAKDVQRGDAVLSALNGAEMGTVGLSVQTSKHYEELTVRRADAEYFELLGWYLAEGCTSVGQGKYEVDFTLCAADEMPVAEWIRDAMLRWHGVSCRITERRGSISVRCTSAAFGKQVLKLFGSGAPNKTVPMDWLGLPEDHLRALLRGLIAGDGHVSERNVFLSTSSRQLAGFTLLALKRLGICASMKTRPAHVGKDGTNHRVSYLVTSSDNRMCDILTDPFAETVERRTTWFEDGEHFAPVREVRVVHYDGPVYNLEVEEDNSYSTMFASVSNCHPRDSIALSYAGRNAGVSFDLPSAFMAQRENHMEFLAKEALRLARHPTTVTILGRSFKPETNIETGSPAILLARIFKGYGVKVTHIEDGDPETFENLVVIGTKHARYADLLFRPGSTVLDPFRIIPYQTNVRVVRIGDPL